MPSRTHEYREGDQHGCWTVIREEAPERKSWGLQRRVLARCRCGHERVVLPKMLHRNADYCQKCNPGRKPTIVYNPGDQYGPWTVIREVEGRRMPSGWARQILVRCECGEEVVVVRQQLLRSTRCRRCTRSVEIRDGDVFGDLTVIEELWRLLEAINDKIEPDDEIRAVIDWVQKNAPEEYPVFREAGIALMRAMGAATDKHWYGNKALRDAAQRIHDAS